MKKIVLLCCVLCLAITAGCAATRVNKQWAATGGSRSDATVELSYDYGPMEIPVVDDNQGIAMAIMRCQAWGYQSAAPFGGVTKVCSNTTSNMWGQVGCATYLVTKQYQCLGQGTEVKSNTKR